jgi:hypothetical protein
MTSCFKRSNTDTAMNIILVTIICKCSASVIHNKTKIITFEQKKTGVNWTKFGKLFIRLHYISQFNELCKTFKLKTVRWKYFFVDKRRFFVRV